MMGKRNSPVILSSDDEDDIPSNRSFSKPKKTNSLSTRTNPRPSKKPRRSSSRYSLRTDCSNVDEVKVFGEDFDDFFTRAKVSTGFESSNVKELWVDKYKPRSFDELAIHKKKVQEVKAWFEERLDSSSEEIGRSHVLVVTGQAGVGKSTAIHVIASHFGATVCEWNAPTPTIWQEHLHNASTGIHYTSKLDEFINFIEKIRKYGLISSSFLVESRKSTIVLIDDLPVITGRVAFEKFRECLVLLARSTRVPTVILVTDHGKADSGDSSSRLLEELLISLENVGACKVALNPITNNSIKKVLTKICRLEQCNATAEQIDLIANDSGGDIRHAILSLQLFSLKPDLVLNLSILDNSNCLDRKMENTNDLVGGYSLLFGKDETLSLFHALGKFLHNKREAEVAAVSGPNGCVLKEKFSRLPMKMDDPEKVLCQAHGQSRPIADFLYENVLDFISEEGMGDAWDVASYLSDADLLLSSFRGMVARNNEIENVLQSAAASVAVRGVLFGNSNPLSSRWHAIRKPKLWQAEQSMLRNQKEMVKRRFVAYGGSSSSELSVVATEYSPVLKWLEYRASAVENKVLEHPNCNGTDEESCETMDLDDEERQISEDEIEDW